MGSINDDKKSIYSLDVSIFNENFSLSTIDLIANLVGNIPRQRANMIITSSIAPL